MASVNKVILIGHLGADPETRYTPAGDAVGTLRLATSEKWKDKNSGESRESTEWHRVVLFCALAEIADRYLKKGALVYIEGRLRSRKWQDKSGLERYTTEVEATEMRMLGDTGKSDVTPHVPCAPEARKVPENLYPWLAPGGNKSVNTDSIPF